MSTWWCELALIDGAVQPAVELTVTDGRITSVTPNSQRADSVDALPGLTLPGFANAHSHAFHRALRSRVQASRGTFWTWRDLMYRAAERLNPDNYHRLARAVFAEMAMSGASCVGEFHYVHHQPDGSAYADPNAMGEAVLAAAAEAGIRITMLDTIYLHGGMGSGGYVPVSDSQRRFSDATSDEWIARVDALRPGKRQQVGGAIHSVRAVDPASMRAVADWARTKNVPLHAHVSEQRAENEQSADAHGLTPTQLLAESGALDTNFTAVHATHLTKRDLTLLGDASSGICICPTTEADLGDGIGPTTELVAAGSALCLGSDSHAVIDPLIEARTLELDERLRSEQRGLHSARELIEMTTKHGHRSLGWDDAGELSVGNRADLTTIDLGSVRTAGADAANALEAAVFAATASDVTSVIIDGEQLVADGQHHSIDVAAELRITIEELFA